MKRVWLIHAFICVAMLLMGSTMTEAGSCNPEGVWYGHNSYPEDLIVTFTKSSGGTFTGLAMNHKTNSQGQIKLKRNGKYDAKWLTYVEGDGGLWIAVYMHGTMTMTSCDTWESFLDWDLYAFNPGTEQDPLVDGFYLGTWPDMFLSYKRLP